MTEQLQTYIDQTVAILIDGNNIEYSLHSLVGDDQAMIDFDTLVPTILENRALARLIYFREGRSISKKLADRLRYMFHGSVMPCHKSADVPLTIRAVQIASKVDTIVLMSGDADYVELIRHLKSQGVRVEVAAIRASTAQVVLDECDHFFPITEEFHFSLKNEKDSPNKTKSKTK